MDGPTEITFEVREADEGGYYAAAIGYDIITQGDSWEDLKLMAQDAVLCHFGHESAPEEAHAAHSLFPTDTMITYVLVMSTARPGE